LHLSGHASTQCTPTALLLWVVNDVQLTQDPHARFEDSLLARSARARLNAQCEVAARTSCRPTSHGVAHPHTLVRIVAGRAVDNPAQPCHLQPTHCNTAIPTGSICGLTMHAERWRSYSTLLTCGTSEFRIDMRACKEQLTPSSQRQRLARIVAPPSTRRCTSRLPLHAHATLADDQVQVLHIRVCVDVQPPHDVDEERAGPHLCPADGRSNRARPPASPSAHLVRAVAHVCAHTHALTHAHAAHEPTHTHTHTRHCNNTLYDHMHFIHHATHESYTSTHSQHTHT
jgi:hypothetical protein